MRLASGAAAAIAAVLTLLPMILYVRHFPASAPLSMFANDTFYYLDVARNSQGTPFFSFDGAHPTNGFHPVWQGLLYLAVKYRLLDLADPTHALVQLFYGNLAILGAAVFGLALAAARYLRHPWLALLTVCPGWLWFPMALSAPGYLACWSNLNGMETAIGLLFFAAVLLTCGTSALRLHRFAWTCLFLGMMVLSRLDDVFFLLPLLGFLLLRMRRPSRRAAWALASVPLLMIAVYLVYNLHSTGRAMPVSGAAKAALAYRGNLSMLGALFLPAGWDAPRGEAAVGFSIFAEQYMRLLQMLGPMLLAALYLARPRPGCRTPVDALCVGVLLKGAYNFCFVALFDQGFWYYGSSVFTANLVLSLAVDHALTRPLPDALPRAWRWAAVCGEGVFVLLCMNIFVNDKLNNNPGTQMQTVLARRTVLADMVRRSGGGGFIEFDDGILGFATGMGSISGFGLVADPEARLARKQGRFFDLAMARGDSLVMARGAYAIVLEDVSEHARTQPGRELAGIHNSEFLEYTLEPVARDGETDVRLYRLVRRPH